MQTACAHVWQDETFDEDAYEEAEESEGACSPGEREPEGEPDAALPPSGEEAGGTDELLDLLKEFQSMDPDGGTSNTTAEGMGGSLTRAVEGTDNSTRTAEGMGGSLTQAVEGTDNTSTTAEGMGGSITLVDDMDNTSTIAEGTGGSINPAVEGTDNTSRTAEGMGDSINLAVVGSDAHTTTSKALQVIEDSDNEVKVMSPVAAPAGYLFCMSILPVALMHVRMLSVSIGIFWHPQV